MAFARLGWLFAGLILVSGFQNCGQTASSSSTDLAVGAAQERVIGPTNHYNKIIYDQNLETDLVASTPRLEIDLNQGQVIFYGLSCALDPARMGSLKALLLNSQVCEPGPLGPGMVSCMALGLADIELSDGGQNDIRLRPVICNSGTYLCDGQDKTLRALLSDLVDHPPTGCMP